MPPFVVVQWLEIQLDHSAAVDDILDELPRFPGDWSKTAKPLP